MNENLTLMSVETLKPGNQVDMTSCLHMRDTSLGQNLYAVVDSVVEEVPGCILVTFEDPFGPIGYEPGTMLQVVVPQDVPDPEIQVMDVKQAGIWSTWKISQNLTDRWGDLNFHNQEEKPLQLLQDDQLMLSSLRDQMWCEDTFITRKDGQFGILFEVEYRSIESEGGAGYEVEAGLRPQADVQQLLLKELGRIAEHFPGVEFAVPHASNIIHDRPAVWAFVKDGLLNEQQRDDLGDALNSL